MSEIEYKQYRCNFCHMSYDKKSQIDKHKNNVHKTELYILPTYEEQERYARKVEKWSGTLNTEIDEE